MNEQENIDFISAFSVYQDPGFLKVFAKYNNTSVIDLEELFLLGKKRPVLGYMSMFLGGPENFGHFEQWWKKTEKLNFSYLNILTNTECPSLESYLISPNENYNMIVDLRAGEENLIKTFKKYKRRNINRAMKQNIVIRDPESNTELKEMYQIFFQRSQQGKLFEVPCLSFINELILSNYGKALIATYEDKIVGGSFFVLGHKIMSGLVAGYDREYSYLDVGNLINYKMMLWGISAGYEFFDMGHQSLSQNPNLTLSKMQFRPILKPAFVYNIPKSKSKKILTDTAKYLSERFVKSFVKK